MKKRILSLLLTTVMAVGMLTGCGGEEATEATPAAESSSEVVGASIEVKEEALNDVAVDGDFSDADLTVFIFAQEHEKTVYQSLIDKFMETTGAKVTFEVTTSDEYAQKIGYQLKGTDFAEQIKYTLMADDLYMSFRYPTSGIGVDEEKFRENYENALEIWDNYLKGNVVNEAALSE